MAESSSTKRILNYIVCAYVLSYVLPSGIIAGVRLQKFLAVVILLCTSAIMISGGYTVEIIKKSKFEMMTAVFGLIWCLAGWYTGRVWSTTVFMLLYIGVVLLLAFKYLSEYGFLNMDMIIQSLFIMLLLKMLLKFLMETAFVVGIFDYDGVSRFYMTVFSAEATTMTMNFGSVELVRIQDSSDAVVFTLLPFYWFMPEKSGKKRGILLILIAAYALIVFSRIYLVEAASFVLVTVLYYWKSIPCRQKIAGAGGVILIVAVFAKPLIEMLIFRFFSSFTMESDTIRAVQMEKLWKGIQESPVLGHGMGSYLPDYIRSGMFPFSYEMEYLSFIYQLGILGFVLIIGGITGIFIRRIYPYYKENPVIIKTVSLLGVGWFLFRPMLNPSFLGKQNQFLLIGVFLMNVWYQSKQNSCCMNDDQI